MTASPAQLFTNTDFDVMQTTFAQQKAAFAARPYPSVAERIHSLQKLKAAILSNQDALAAAINADFSCRSTDETRLAEVMTTVEGINTSIKKIKKWMKPSKRHVGVLFAPASNKVVFQPLGVVGIIVPWNYPLFLSLGPLVTALTAGNRAMIKVSEFTPNFNKALITLLNDIFDQSEVSVIEGEADISASFSKLAFDHLLFTGSTAVGKHIMRAAAENLTPVTLELGGKSPAIIAPTANMKDAAERICFGKSLNAGQTCVAPDYVLVPKGREEEFKTAYQVAFASMYPTIKDNDDYSAIINERQHQRLQAVLKSAAEAGATLTQVNPASEDFSGTRKMPLSIVENAPDDSVVMQDEIFGPILPLVSYQGLDKAIAYVQERPRPLALYLFSYDKAEQEKVLLGTHSGGVTINNSLVHLAQEDMPFGGVGPSGMGHYHGYEGFLTLSKAKAVHRIGKFNSGKFAYPPYNTPIHKLIYKLFIR
jgi:coniferyl-aldehyde dehydrogenase